MDKIILMDKILTNSIIKNYNLSILLVKIVLINDSLPSFDSGPGYNQRKSK